MAGQDFTITPLKYSGGKYVRDFDQPQLTWNVGNRAIPKQPWSYGVELRTSREEYPGAGFNPVEQIMGANLKQFTLEGMFDDRWDSPGFADRQRRLLQEAGSSGRAYRIAFEVLSFDGLIKNVEFKYLNSFRIGYSFTFSPHSTDDQGPEASQGSARKTSYPVSAYVDTISQAITQLIETNALAPVAYISGTLCAATTAVVNDIASRSSSIADVVAGRVLVVLPPAIADRGDAPVNSVKKVAADLEGLRATSMSLVHSLSSVSADTNVFYTETLLALNFDSWSRLLCAQARSIAVQAREAAVELRRRAEPDAQALYQARAGESLYDIADRFYQAPSAWRAIAARNNLFQLELDGTELLIIPQSK